MKSNTSSSLSPRGLFTSILFAALTAFAVSALSGCGAAAGDEHSARAADELTTEPVETTEITFDPNVAQLAPKAPPPASATGPLEGVHDGITPPRPKQNLQ